MSSESIWSGGLSRVVANRIIRDKLIIKSKGKYVASVKLTNVRQELE